MNHVRSIDRVSYLQIISGEKNIYCSKDKEKWNKIQVGDKLAIHCGLDSTYVEFKVLSVISSVNFQTLYNICGPNITHCESNNERVRGIHLARISYI